MFGCFHKFGGLLWGILIIRILLCWGSVSGPPIFWIYDSVAVLRIWDLTWYWQLLRPQRHSLRAQLRSSRSCPCSRRTAFETILARGGLKECAGSQQGQNGCFCNLGLHFLGFLLLRALPFGSVSGPLIFGSSQIDPNRPSSPQRGSLLLLGLSSFGV